MVSDSLGSSLVLSLEGTATKMRHYMRHVHSFMERVKCNENVLKHISTNEMPADFLTKWVAGDKAQRSIRYLTNARALE